MNICLSIPFPSTEYAELAHTVVTVDKVFKISGVKRTLEVDGTILTVNFHGEELRRLRVAANGFIRHIKLIVKTVEGNPRILI